jgi:hypothetical protein
VIAAAFAVVVAQTCAALLPPREVQISWSRNGQAYASDVPVSSSATDRVYRRTFRNGSEADVPRTLTCTTGPLGPMLQERLATTDVSFPLQLNRTQVVTLDGATVRRIDAPDNGGGLWFSVSRYGPQLYGLRERIGIGEVRIPTISGRVDVLRAVLNTERVMSDSAPSDALVRRLNTQLAEQERRNRELRDTIAAQQRQAEQDRRVLTDSIAALAIRPPVIDGALATRAARLIADSAARLPSADAARAWGWVWPGAGHAVVHRSGALWATTGAIGAGALATGLALPDLVQPVRIGAIAGGAGLYLLSLFVSHARLEQAIRSESLALRTRESFLRGASVTVSPDGRLTIVLQAPTR